MNRLDSGQTAIIIGPAVECALLEQQLDLLPKRPVTLGWVVTHAGEFGVWESGASSEGAPILGEIDQLEAIIARRRPATALVTMPGAASDQIRSVRTRLRRLGVADRYMPPLHDQLAGVGPRTEREIDFAALIGRADRDIDTAAIDRLIRRHTVLITGAGGSIGSELARGVAQHEPRRLILVERSENALFEIDRQIARFSPALARKAVLHDIVERDATQQLFGVLRPDVIFHAAAHKHVPMMEDHPAAAVDNNVFGTKSVTDAADACGASRCVIISTDKAVNPTSIMGATKRLAEMYVQWKSVISTTRFAIVRFGNVLGSSGSVLDIWARQIREGGPITITDPRMTRYFMTIPEAAALVMQSATLAESDNRSADVFLLDMGEPVRIAELARRFVEQHGFEPMFDAPPSSSTTEGALAQRACPGALRIVAIGARPGEKLHEELSRDDAALHPTRHADIDIWSLPTPEQVEIARILGSLNPTGRPADPGALAEAIRALLPEMTRPVAA